MINPEAPVVDVWIDVFCPITREQCGQSREAVDSELTQRRLAGEVTVAYHFTTAMDRLSSGTAYSTRGAEAALIIAERDPERFTAFVETILATDHFPDPGVHGYRDGESRGLSDEEIARLATEAGVAASVVDDLNSTTYAEWLEAATRQADRDGIDFPGRELLD